MEIKRSATLFPQKAGEREEKNNIDKKRKKKENEIGSNTTEMDRKAEMYDAKVKMNAVT